MRTISLFTRVPLLLAAVAASHVPASCPHAAAATNADLTEVAGIRTKPKSASPSDRAVAFYYPWYGNPATDGHYANWNHPVAVRDESPRSYPGGDDIGSNFYPSRGCYSVNDPEVLREHVRQLRQAGVRVLCASWWGKDSFTDRALPGLFKAAEKASLLINFHIKPFPGRNAASTRAAISYLVGRFGASPACHRLRNRENKPVFFIYDYFETAIPKQIPGFSYLDYQPLASDYYLDRTAQWIRRMNSK